MSDIGWTAQQESAIMRRNKKLLVSAAAGAGKTAVLVERIIRRVLDNEKPIDIDKLMVVTFTNAAAQEMRERIRMALGQKAKAEPHNKRLRRQLLLLDKSSISTLHSFCLDIIRTNYYRLKLPLGLALDPHFRVAEEIETLLLKMDVLAELLENKYSSEEPAFLELVEKFGGERDDLVLQDMVLNLYEFSRSQPQPEKWLKRLEVVFQEDPDQQMIQNLLQSFLEEFFLSLEESLAKLAEAREFCLAPGGPCIYLPNIEEEHNQLKSCLRKSRGSWEQMLLGLRDIKFCRLKPCRKEINPDLKDKVQTLRNDAKSIILKLQNDFLARTPQELLQDMKVLAPIVAELVNLVNDFSLSYLQGKLDKNIIDFSDIEHFALLLLKGEDSEVEGENLAEKLKQRYREVLIDEYQDINAVQETILSSVSDNNNLFMVGDVKQSIYAFRSAEPSLFIEKANSFIEDIAAAEEKILLPQNFRSRKEIIDGVNFIYRQLMNGKIGGISYDKGEELVYSAFYPDRSEENVCIEVNLIETDMERESFISLDNEEEEEPENNEESDLDNIQAEARVIGDRILELLAMKVWDNKEQRYRSLQYRDIVVIIRSTKTTAPVFLEELQGMGIPAYADVGTGYFAALEIQLILSLLKIIDNSHQDIPLAAVLRSPLVGLQAEELALIRLHYRRADFYDALRLAARREGNRLGNMLRVFLNNLRIWRTYARRHSLVELVSFLYRETHLYNIMGALPGGRQRQANLRSFYDRAVQFERTKMKGLYRFLCFIEKLEDTRSDLGAARTLGENEDVVRIMSIHKSKGLEFPIVFLAGLGRRFNMQDLNKELLIDKELGIGPYIADSVLRVKYPTLARMAVKNKLKQETLAEEMRILYVAMTRAKESLILVGTVKGLKKKIEGWSKAYSGSCCKLPDNLVANATSYWDWLVPCLLKHESGSILRKIAGCHEQDVGEEEPSRWQIKMRTKQGLAKQVQTAEKTYQEKLIRIKNLQPLEVEEVSAKVEAILDWEYPFAEQADIPAKFSVTEIKNRYREREQTAESLYFHKKRSWRRPAFLQEDTGLTASEKGTALHQILRYLDLDIAPTEDRVAFQIEELIKKELITPIQGQAISLEHIVGFLNNPIGERMRRSKQVMREVPFIFQLPAEELFSERKDIQGENIIIQGTIDCLFREQDGLILIDYKTDLITEETVEFFVQNYKKQMELYSRAVESIMQEKVKERILYSFQLGKGITV